MREAFARWAVPDQSRNWVTRVTRVNLLKSQGISGCPTLLAMGNQGNREIAGKASVTRVTQAKPGWVTAKDQLNQQGYPSYPDYPKNEATTIENEQPALGRPAKAPRPEFRLGEGVCTMRLGVVELAVNHGPACQLCAGYRRGPQWCDWPPCPVSPHVPARGRLN